MDNANKKGPTRMQCKPFERLIAALEAVGFEILASGGDDFDLWLEARRPPNGNPPPMDAYEGRALGEHSLHFSFDCRTGKIDSYGITRDEWERTDEHRVVEVKF